METSAGLETKPNESKRLLASSNTQQKCNLHTYHWIIIVIVAIVITALASNMDRIISSLKEDEGDNTTNYDSYDIVIIGGGASGLLNANLLRDAYPNKRVVVLEQLNRIGGRQFSSKVISNINTDTIVFDHCAFRTTPTNYTMKVLQYLDICDELYPYSSYFIVNSSWTLFEIRNYKIPNKDMNISYWSNVFNLNSNDIAMLTQFGDATQAILNISSQTILDENGATTLPETDEEWIVFRNNWTFQGVPLNQWEFASMVQMLHVFSSEFLAMSSVYAAFKGLQSGFTLSFLLQSPLFAATINGSNYYVLKSGYNKISKGLYDRFGAENVKLNEKVIGIDKDITNNKYIVETINNEKYEAHDIILSIPIDNIKELLPNISPLRENDKLWNILNHFQTRVTMKMVLVYDTSVFTEKELNILNGITYSESHSVAVEQLYFTQNGTLCYLMLYANIPNIVDFWWNLQETTKYDLYEISDDIYIDNINDTVIASKTVINEVTNELNTFLDLYNITMRMPLVGFLSLWGKDLNFGAATSNALPDINVDFAIKESLKPNENENIYISIVDFSLNPNVVEGAFWNVIENIMTNFHIENNPLQQYQGCLS